MKRPNAITASLAAAALLCLVAAAGGGAPRPRPATAPAVAAPKAAVDTLFFDDFESDTLAWSTVDVLVQPPYWHIDSYNAYSGSSWWCGTYDPGFATNPGYGDAWVQYLHSPVLDLSAVVSDSVVLGFRQFYSVEGPSGGSDWDCVN
ncbi:hypothetical protein EG831_10465, partial [bacterium]|nr:hypothetical protein [bacterium]